MMRFASYYTHIDDEVIFSKLKGVLSCNKLVDIRFLCVVCTQCTAMENWRNKKKLYQIMFNKHKVATEQHTVIQWLCIDNGLLYPRQCGKYQTSIFLQEESRSICSDMCLESRKCWKASNWEIVLWNSNFILYSTVLSVDVMNPICMLGHHEYTTH